MTCGFAPRLPRVVRSFDRVAQVLAIPVWDLAHERAVGTHDAARIALIGTCLLAADEQLRRAIDCRSACSAHLRRFRERQLELLARARAARDLLRLAGSCLSALEVLPHAFAPALAAEAAFAIAAEPGGCVE